MLTAGLYGENQLLGAKARIISSPAYELFGEDDNEKLYYITKIRYRVTTDGKMYPSISLEGLDNRSFLPGELEIVELSNCSE